MDLSLCPAAHKRPHAGATKPKALSLIRCLVPSGIYHPVHGSQSQVILFIPAADKIHHTYTPDRIHHLGYGSFWLLSSSIYKWVFSAAAGAENLARSTSRPVPFWLSKIVDFDSKSTRRFVRRFRQQNQGEHGFPYRALALLTLRNSICTVFGAVYPRSIAPQGKKRRFGSYQVTNNRLNN